MSLGSNATAPSHHVKSCSLADQDLTDWAIDMSTGLDGREFLALGDMPFNTMKGDSIAERISVCRYEVTGYVMVRGIRGTTSIYRHPSCSKISVKNGTPATIPYRRITRDWRISESIDAPPCGIEEKGRSSCLDYLALAIEDSRRLLFSHDIATIVERRNVFLEPFSDLCLPVEGKKVVQSAVGRSRGGSHGCFFGGSVQG